MKLTAPPPPPPEPPTPGEPPAGEAPREPDPVAPAAVTPPPPDDAPPPPPPAPKPATWPLWYGGADTAIVVLTVGLAFLVASFAARNSDLWVHLAAGRMITTGEYRPGGADPLSFTAADRTWVNHSWLFDLGAYLLYSPDGVALVAVKAVAFAAAFALLFAIRRPGHSLWPWAAVGVAAMLAASPRMVLGPLVGSVFFFALTLFLIFRVPNPPGSWRLPTLVGVTFWLWAGTDAWFFVGPLALALLLVGELVRTKGLNADGPATPADDPLGALPDLGTLAKTLAVGVVACCLTPHHVRVWEVPFELTGGPGVEDPRLAGLVLSPMTPEFWRNPSFGYNLNGAALIALYAAGVYAVALTALIGRALGRPFDVEPLPLPHALLWCGVAALAAKSSFAVPLLAVVTVPLVAARVNLFAAAVPLRAADDTRTRLVLTAATLGRVLGVAGLLALGAVAWPGWLHGNVGATAGTARRVDWHVLPDPGLKRAAEQLGEWRAAGRLGPDDRGFLGSIDLANYAAWFAPGERVFANGRYTHHRAEWPEFLQTRRGLGIVRSGDGAADLREAAAVFEKYKLGYAAVAGTATDPVSVKKQAEQVMGRMWGDPERWSPWYVDGRTAISGWRASRAAAAPAFAALRVDPVALAFGPAAAATPPGGPDVPPGERTWADDFLTPTRPAPPGADESRGWAEFGAQTARNRMIAYQVGALLTRAVPTAAAPALPGNAVHVMADQLNRAGSAPQVNPGDGVLEAVGVLAVKAARRGIAENPDHPDSYWALAQALGLAELPIPPGERAAGRVVALRQALDRFPPPDDYVPNTFVASPAVVCEALKFAYLGQQLGKGTFVGARTDVPGVQLFLGELVVADGPALYRVPARMGGTLRPEMRVVGGPAYLAIDEAHRTAGLTLRYAERELRFGTDGESKERRDFRENTLKGLKEHVDELAAARKAAIDRVRDGAARATKLRERFDLNVQHGLTEDALAIVNTPAAFQELGPDAPETFLRAAALSLVVGRVGDAERLLADIDEWAAKTEGVPPEVLAQVGGAVVPLRQQVLQLTGRYHDAGLLLEQGAAGERFLTTAPPPPPAEALPLRPFAWPLAGPAPSLGTTVGLGFFYQNRYGLYLQTRQGLVGRQDYEAGFFMRRGLLALLEGDIPAARARFDAARRPALPAWEIPELVPGAAAQYLRLIDRAAGR